MKRPIELDRQDPQHRALARLILARSDIRAARSAATHVVEHVKDMMDPLYEPLLCAAVICYTRPFITSRQYPGIPKKYKVLDDSTLQALHDNLIEFRNTFIAHRDADLNKVTLIPKGSTVSWGDGKAKGTLTSHGDFVRNRHLPLEGFPYLCNLCEAQLKRLEEHISTEKDRLFP